MKTTPKQLKQYLQLLVLDKPTILSIAKVANVPNQILFTRKAFQEAGMPEELVNLFAAEWRNGDGDVILGIYGLDVLMTICKVFNLQYKQLFSRAMQAAQCFVTIERFCNS